MGGHDELRDFLLYLFPQFFSVGLPEGTSFDVVIVDGTQFMVANNFKKKGEAPADFRADDAAQRMVDTVNYYANHKDYVSAPIVGKALVIMMDTPNAVPRNKSVTQMVRDKTTNPTEKILNASVYDELMERMGLSPESDLLIDEGRVIPGEVFASFSMWRSCNTRWQFNSLVAKTLLKSIKMGRGKVLIIDDAVVMPHQTYISNRKMMLRDYHFQERTNYEKEVLIAHIMTRQLASRFILYDDEKFARLPVTGIGEADVKACNYIARDNGTLSHLLVSQDSDMFHILLAHMKRMINPETGRFDDGMRLFVDSQTPKDKKEGTCKPYRYIDIRGLYEAILALFSAEYPCIEHPIETLMLLFHLNETDFTQELPSFLKMNWRRVWDTFSELHHVSAVDENKKNKKDEPGYLTFTPTPSIMPRHKTVETRARSKIRDYPNSLLGVLGGEGVITLTHTDDENIHFGINMARVARFMIAMCQRPLIDDMSKLKMHYRSPMSPALSSRPYYEEVTVLSLHAREILDSIKEFRQEEEMNSLLKPPPKSPVVTMNKSFKPTLGSIGAAVKTNPLQRFDKSVIVELSRKFIPPNYGIPTQSELNARLARVLWLLNYLQNGGINNYMANTHCKTMPLEKEISRFGWVRKPIGIESALDFNCAYYEHECVRTNKPVLASFSIEETTCVKL